VRPIIRVFKVPSKTNPSQIHVGIPDIIKLRNVKSIDLSQVEILPPPKTLAELIFRKPKVIQNKPINADKNVETSVLAPGFKINASYPLLGGMIKIPLDVEEVNIPDGFVHLDDISRWNVYNYNKGYKITDENFGTLPGEENLPLKIRYRLFVKGRELYVKHDKQIDSCEIYYKRLYRDSNLESYWIKLVSLNNRSGNYEFPHNGEFMLRIVPTFKGKPLAGFQDTKVMYEEVDEFDYDIVQLSPDRYQVRMEGVLGETINHLEVMEGSSRRATVRLSPDKEGRIEKSFRINNVSATENTELDFYFYRRNKKFKSFIRKEKRTIYPKLAIEPVILNVTKLDKDTFEVYIEDTQNLLYTPINSVSPFDGVGWNTAVQTGKLMCHLQITRHQDGEAYSYGYYPVNITSELEPHFISAPPFGNKATRFDKGYKFIFEDTKEFRTIRNLDDPNLQKSISYEFRLLFWTTGIESSLRFNSEYTFSKETPIFVKKKRRSYKYSYNTWKEEHPRRKYFNIIPKDLKFSSVEELVLLSSSPNGFLLTATPQPIPETTNIEIQQLGWKVLYFYNDKEDEIQTFPYYSFDIEIPDSSKLSIDTITVSIDNPDGPNIVIGVYHPSDRISIVDFIGYYEARKIITRKVNIIKASDKQERRIDRRRRRRRRRNSKKTSSRRHRDRATNTRAKRNMARTNQRSMNYSITKSVERGILVFNVDINYKNNTTTTKKHGAFIASIPRLPPEPIENQCLSVGHKTITTSRKIVDRDIAKNVENQIKSVSNVRKSLVGRK